MSKKTLSAQDVIERLSLEQSPTGGGWFKHVHSEETTQCDKCDGSAKRVVSTDFIYLLDKSSVHQWHRFRSTLIWRHLAGSSAKLCSYDLGFTLLKREMGSDIVADQQPVLVVPARNWQRIRTTGDWSLVSCTHASGFDFSRLEIAEEGWTPSEGKPNLRFPAESWA